MSEINCEKCTRRKHCFVKEFTVLSCEDYKEENTIVKVSENRNESERGES